MARRRGSPPGVKSKTYGRPGMPRHMLSGLEFYRGEILKVAAVKTCFPTGVDHTHFLIFFFVEVHARCSWKNNLMPSGSVCFSLAFEADTQMTGVNDRSAAEQAGIIPSTRRLSGLSQTARSGFFRNDRSLRNAPPGTQNRADGQRRGCGGRGNSMCVNVSPLATLAPQEPSLYC